MFPAYLVLPIVNGIADNVLAIRNYDYVIGSLNLQKVIFIFALLVLFAMNLVWMALILKMLLRTLKFYCLQLLAKA